MNEYPRTGTCLGCGQPLLRTEMRHIYHENCLRATVDDLTERQRAARAVSIQATPNLRRKREKETSKL